MAVTFLVTLPFTQVMVVFGCVGQVVVVEVEVVVAEVEPLEGEVNGNAVTGADREPPEKLTTLIP